MGEIVERLPVGDATGRCASHLEVSLARPSGEKDPGLAVLYLHGLGSRKQGEKADFFRRRFLHHGLAFCSFDFQGHGESGGDMLDLSLSRNLEDVGRVHGFLRSRGAERLILFGSSMGGGTALWYAGLHPDDVVAAVHIAPALELERGLERRLGAVGMRRWQKTGTVELEHHDGVATLGWGLVEDLRAFRKERLEAIYQTPTLLLQGRNDESVSWQSVVGFAENCACDALEVHLMMDGDHRLSDRLDHLWRLTIDFLEVRGVV